MVNGPLFQEAHRFYKMEEIAKHVTVYISHALEIASAVVIAAGLVKLIFTYLHTIARNQNSVSSIDLRVNFGSAVAVSLELLLGADVLATAVAPSWDDIGKLAAIATLRTALNFFLEKELKHNKPQA